MHSPKLAHTSHTKRYAKGKLTLKVGLVPYGNRFFCAYNAVGSIQSCVLFLKNERKTKNKQKKTAKKKKNPTVYRFVTAKI